MKNVVIFILVVVIVMLAVQVSSYREINENLMKYNQLEGETTWKIEYGVVHPDLGKGFALYGPNGERIFRDNTPDKYIINYETGEVQYNERWYE